MKTFIPNLNMKLKANIRINSYAEVIVHYDHRSLVFGVVHHLLGIVVLLNARLCSFFLMENYCPPI